MDSTGDGGSQVPMTIIPFRCFKQWCKLLAIGEDFIMFSLHVLNAIYKKTYESIVHFPGTYVLVDLKCSSAIFFKYNS